MNQPVRHGDILLVPDKLPKGAVKRAGLSLAEGKATGHDHVLASGEVYELGPTRYASLKIASTVSHEEHFRTPVPVGVFRVQRQQEFVQDAPPRTVID